MASVLPFNKATINSVDIDTDEFVNGSGTLTKKGNDKAVTTSDNRIHNVREKINREAKFEAYGDKTALNSAAGLGTTIVLSYGVTQVDTFTGIATAAYNDSSKTTSITIKGDPS